MHWARARQKVFGASGVDKSGTQSLTGNGVWTKIVDYLVRSGFPATMIEDNGIRVPVGQTVTYAGQVVSMGTSNGSTASMQGRIMNGSTVVESKSISSISQNTATFSGGTIVGTGELVTLEFWTNSLSNSRHIVSPSTWFTLVP